MASTQTQGMQLQTQKQLRAIDELRGDLMAISILREISRRPLETNFDSALTKREFVITFEGKKKLWNAQSRLISRVTAKLFTCENPNSLESILARELIGLASYSAEVK